MLIGIGIGAALFYKQGQAAVIAPSEPRNLFAVPGIENVTLYWGAPANNGGSPITEYRIYRVLDSPSSLLASVSGDRYRYTDTTGIPGTTYSYYVKAINYVGAGPNSDPVSASSIIPQITPTGLFIGIPTPVNSGYQLTFGPFTPTTNFSDCNVVIAVNGVSSAAQAIVFPGNVFTAPSEVAITWTDLGADGAFSLGDYLMITSGTPNSPLPLPGGTYTVNIVFIHTGGTICSQTWTAPSESTPIGSFTGIPTSVTNGYKLTFGVITPSTQFTDCKVIVFIIGVASEIQTINLVGNTFSSLNTAIEWTDLASDGSISTGDYLTITGGTIAVPVVLPTGSYSIIILFTATGGAICSQSWTF